MSEWQATVTDMRGRPLLAARDVDWELGGGRSVYIGARRGLGKPDSDGPWHLTMLAEVVIVVSGRTEMDTVVVKVPNPPGSSQLAGGLEPFLVPALVCALEKAATVAQAWEDRRPKDGPF